jgi:radical SAM superfamily enzyme YgiQ (UPF0313 family)
MHQYIALLTPPAASHRTAEENLGIGYLAAALRQLGHQVVVIDGWLLNLAPKGIVERLSAIAPPDLIGISAYFSSIDDVANLIQLIRGAKISCPIVTGGYGPTFHPEDFLSIGADFVLRGKPSNRF